MVKIATTLLVADAAVIWQAVISTEHLCNRCYIWLLGALLATAAIGVILAAAYLIKPVLYAAVSIELSHRCGAPVGSGARYDGLVSMFLSTTYGPAGYIESLEGIAGLSELATRRAKLRELPPPYRAWAFAKSLTGVVLLMLSALQWGAFLRSFCGKEPYWHWTTAVGGVLIIPFLYILDVVAGWFNTGEWRWKP